MQHFLVVRIPIPIFQNCSEWLFPNKLVQLSIPNPKAMYTGLYAYSMRFVEDCSAKNPKQDFSHEKMQLFTKISSLLRAVNCIQKIRNLYLHSSQNLRNLILCPIFEPFASKTQNKNFVKIMLSIIQPLCCCNFIQKSVNFQYINLL